MGGLLVLVALMSPLAKGSVWLYGYALTILSIGVLQFSFLGSSEHFWLSTTTYLIIPLICGRNVITSEQFDRVLLGLSVIAFPNVLGLLAQFAGYQSAFLTEEFTMTSEEVHTRYTSLVGGALALGLMSAISGISSAYWLIIRQQHRIYCGLVFMASVMCLYFSYSRRAYVFFAIGLLIIIWRRAPTYTRVNLGMAGLFMLLAIGTLVAIALGDVQGILARLASIGDVASETEGLRVIKWLEAVDTMLMHPILGVGFGASGTIGREPSDFWDIRSAISAESYYLQMGMEGGLLTEIVVVLVVGHTAMASLTKLAHRPQLLLTTSLLVCFAIESFPGTSLISPFAATIYWLAFGINRAFLRVGDQVILRPSSTTVHTV